MSAFVVSKKTIDAIVTGLAHYKLVTCPHAREPVDSDCADHLVLALACAETAHVLSDMGQTLWYENIQSVNARYGEPHDAEPVYQFTPVHVDAVTLHKTIACFCYQANEHEGWETSEAKRVCDQLARALEKAHGWEAGSTPPGWDKAPWGLD